MLKKLLLAVGVIGICVGGYFYTQNVTATDMFANIIDRAQPIFTFIKENPLVMTIMGIGGSIMGGLIVNHFKNKAIQVKNTQVEALQSKGFTDNAVISNLQTELKEKNEQIETLKEGVPPQVSTLTTQLSEAQTTINKKELEINRLKERVYEAEQFANITMQPTEAELIARLQKSGYTITKTVH